MNPFYPYVAQRARHRCEYCLAPEAVFNLPIEVEHVVPLSRGGLDTSTNLALACRSCNVHKSFHIATIDPQTETEVPFFNPRTQNWHEHFAVSQDGARLEGLSPAGRATVLRLRMNSRLQVVARHQWRSLGLYP